MKQRWWHKCVAILFTFKLQFWFWMKWKTFQTFLNVTLIGVDVLNRFKCSSAAFASFGSKQAAEQPGEKFCVQNQQNLQNLPRPLWPNWQPDKKICLAFFFFLPIFFFFYSYLRKVSGRLLFNFIKTAKQQKHWVPLNEGP